MEKDSSEVRNKIFQLRKKGLSYAEIAKKLNEEGFKNTRGDEISPSLVSYVLVGKNGAKPKTKNTLPINEDWIKTILTESSLQDGEKIRVLQATFNI